jgi:hypothetical protein
MEAFETIRKRQGDLSEQQALLARSGDLTGAVFAERATTLSEDVKAALVKTKTVVATLIGLPFAAIGGGSALVSSAYSRLIDKMNRTETVDLKKDHDDQIRKDVLALSDRDVVEAAKTMDLVPYLGSTQRRQLAIRAINALQQHANPFDMFEDDATRSALIRLRNKQGDAAFELASKHYPEQREALRRLLVLDWREVFIHCGPKLRKHLLEQKVFSTEQLEEMKHLFTPSEWMKDLVGRQTRPHKVNDLHKDLQGGNLSKTLRRDSSLALVRDDSRSLEIFEQACLARPNEDHTAALMKLRAAALRIKVPESTGKTVTIALRKGDKTVEVPIASYALSAVCSLLGTRKSPADGRVDIAVEEDPHDWAELIRAATSLRAAPHVGELVRKLDDRHLLEAAKTNNLGPYLEKERELAAGAIYALQHYSNPLHMFEDDADRSAFIDLREKHGRAAFKLASKHYPEQREALQRLLVLDWQEVFIHCGPKLRWHLLANKVFNARQLEEMKYLFPTAAYPKDVTQCPKGVARVYEQLAAKDLNLAEVLQHPNTLELVKADPRYLGIYEQACAQLPEEDHTDALMILRAAAFGIDIPASNGETVTVVVTGENGSVEVPVDRAALSATCGLLAELEGDVHQKTDRVEISGVKDAHEYAELIRAVTSFQHAPSLDWLARHADALNYLQADRLLMEMHRILMRPGVSGGYTLFWAAKKAPIDMALPADVVDHWNKVTIDDTNWHIALAYARNETLFPGLAKKVVDHVLSKVNRKHDSLSHHLHLLWQVEGAREGVLEWAAKHTGLVLELAMDEKEVEVGKKEVALEIVAQALQVNLDWVDTQTKWAHLWRAANMNEVARNALVAIAKENQGWVVDGFQNSGYTNIPIDLAFEGLASMWMDDVVLKQGDVAGQLKQLFEGEGEVLTWAGKHPDQVLGYHVKKEQIPPILIAQALGHNPDWVERREEWASLCDAAGQHEIVMDELVKIAEKHPEWVQQSWTTLAEVPTRLVSIWAQ